MRELTVGQCDILEYKTDRLTKKIQFLVQFGDTREEAWTTCEDLKARCPSALCDFLMLHLKWKG